MKTKITLFTFFILLCSACLDPGGEPSFEGFTFSFSNRTDQIYDAQLYIGDLKDGVFVATDSVPITNLQIGYADVIPSYYKDENRWQPDLEAIRNIPSEYAYFKLKLSESREGIIEKFDTSELFKLAIPNGKKFIDDDGRINIYITNDKISGDRYAHLDNN